VVTLSDCSTCKGRASHKKFVTSVVQARSIDVTLNMATNRELSQAAQGEQNQGKGPKDGSAVDREQLKKALQDDQGLKDSIQLLKEELEAVKLQLKDQGGATDTTSRLQFKFADSDLQTWRWMRTLNVSAWVRSMEGYLKETNYPEDKWVPVAVTYLDAKTRNYWDSREALFKMRGPGDTADPVITFEHFKTAMIAAYVNLDPAIAAWTKYENLKQGKMSVEARATESLVAKLGLEGPSEMDKIHRFKSGIHPDMRQKVATRLGGSRWTNFDEVVKFASGV
jgi:hypothetical protein